MSATPRIYELEDNDDLTTEDIKEMFGKTVFKMDFKTAIENKFGNEAIYIYKLNSNLIAGIKIKTFEGEFEYSLNQHLIDLSNALVA
jgi:hypothetical protein